MSEINRGRLVHLAAVDGARGHALGESVLVVLELGEGGRHQDNGEQQHDGAAHAAALERPLGALAPFAFAFGHWCGGECVWGENEHGGSQKALLAQ